jgi:hypothetical protein
MEPPTGELTMFLQINSVIIEVVRAGLIRHRHLVSKILGSQNNTDVFPSIL